MRAIILVLSVFLLSSCDRFLSETGTVGGHAPVSEEAEARGHQLTTMPILLTNVDQLRLRRYPDVKSEMLTTFDENTPIYFTGEATDYEEVIGQKKGPWKKVVTVEGSQEGWVFGAEHFVSTWIDQAKLEKLHEAGKDIRPVVNKSKSEMSKLSGANFDNSLRGTRFSGYYEYRQGEDPQFIQGAMVLRARQFNTTTKKVEYSKCTLDIDEGMPVTELTCVPILTR